VHAALPGSRTRLRRPAWHAGSVRRQSLGYTRRLWHSLMTVSRCYIRSVSSQCAARGRSLNPNVARALAWTQRGTMIASKDRGRRLVALPSLGTPPRPWRQGEAPTVRAPGWLQPAPRALPSEISCAWAQGVTCIEALQVQPFVPCRGSISDHHHCSQDVGG
jgi:hypothetical protein